MKQWAPALEFAFLVALLNLCSFLLVASFGGPLFATEFDKTEVHCALAGTVVAFPFVAVVARYRNH